MNVLETTQAAVEIAVLKAINKQPELALELLTRTLDAMAANAELPTQTVQAVQAPVEVPATPLQGTNIDIQA